jgi:hypothetical protein
MNGDTIAIIVKTSTSGAKTTPIVLYPEEAGDIRVNVTQVSGDATAADNLESYCDGTTPIPANATQVSGDATAADNAEAFFDGTGYAGGTTKLGVNVVAAANDVITAAALAADAGTEIADAVLKRDWTAVTGEAGRSVLNALRLLRNKWAVSGNTLTVCEEDDATEAWTGTLTSAASNPVTGVDPS